ncbi:MAG: nitrite reductase small subunit NirD [Proteobacteria bacterium]|nr:nitrite reductase small subunit NirD [Pseudomonadota bacterium]
MTPDRWIALGWLRDVPARGARRIVTADGPMAIFRTSDDRVFAVEDRCPHKGGPLSQGIVHDSAVTCPLHGWVIDLEKAAARDPDNGCIKSFAVRISAGVVEILLPRIKAAAE